MLQRFIAIDAEVGRYEVEGIGAVKVLPQIVGDGSLLVVYYVASRIYRDLAVCISHR